MVTKNRQIRNSEHAKKMADGSCHYRNCALKGFNFRVSKSGVVITYCAGHGHLADKLFGVVTEIGG